MIEYSTQGTWIIRKLFVMNGSVFPSAFAVALPCALVAMFNKVLIDAGYLEFMRASDSILSETQAWSGFSFLVGFLIVFRTSQAYNRFWDGCTATHQMRAEWFDGCSALVAFSEYGKDAADRATLAEFRGILVRLFSMLHAVALAELEVINAGDGIEEVAAFKFNVLDPGGLDAETIDAVRKSTSKVELVYSWIQCVIVQHMKTGVLTIPPPILSRAFQEIANGMVAFHDAVKMTYIPFPFPYAQTCDCLLVMHWVCTPLVISQWVSNGLWAAVFVFIQVFILWALNFIAIEIENPFGTDPNDLDGDNMQQEMNKHLLLLLKADCTRCPKLLLHASTKEDAEGDEFKFASFYEVWKDCRREGEETEVILSNVYNFTHGHVAEPRRKGRHSHSVGSDVPRVTVNVGRPSNSSGDGSTSQRLRLSFRTDPGTHSGNTAASGSNLRPSSGDAATTPRDQNGKRVSDGVHSSSLSMPPIREQTQQAAQVILTPKQSQQGSDSRSGSKAHIDPPWGSHRCGSEDPSHAACSEEDADSTGPLQLPPVRHVQIPSDPVSSTPLDEKIPSDGHAAPVAMAVRVPHKGIIELV